LRSAVIVVCGIAVTFRFVVNVLAQMRVRGADQREL